MLLLIIHAILSVARVVQCPLVILLHASRVRCHSYAELMHSLTISWYNIIVSCFCDLITPNGGQIMVYHLSRWKFWIDISHFKDPLNSMIWENHQKHMFIFMICQIMVENTFSSMIWRIMEINMCFWWFSQIMKFSLVSSYF